MVDSPNFVIVPLVVLLISAYVTSVPTRSRAAPTCNTLDELLPDPASCSTFYECTLDGPVLLTCPENSEFNPVTHECDDPNVAGCSPKSCNIIGELTPNPADCGSFFECTLDGPELISCPAGLEFSPNEKRCDEPNTAGCSASPGDTTPSPPVPTSGPISSSTTEVTTPPPPSAATSPPTAATSPPTPATSPPTPLPTCRQVGDLIPNPTDCHTFYECTSDGPTLLICPLGTEFNPVELACEITENANCQGIICPKIGEILPNPYDCTTYLECTLDGPVLMPCPPELQYNPATKRCDMPDNGSCPK